MTSSSLGHIRIFIRNTRNKVYRAIYDLAQRIIIGYRNANLKRDLLYLGKKFFPDKPDPVFAMMAYLGTHMPMESSLISSLPNIPNRRTPMLAFHYRAIGSHCQTHLKLLREKGHSIDEIVMFTSAGRLPLFVSFLKKAADNGASLEEAMAAASIYNEKETIYVSIYDAVRLLGTSNSRISNKHNIDACEKQYEEEFVENVGKIMDVIESLAEEVRVPGCNILRPLIEEEAAKDDSNKLSNRIKRLMMHYVYMKASKIDTLSLDEWTLLYDLTAIIFSHSKDIEYSINPNNYIEAGVLEEYRAVVSGVPIGDVIGK